MDFRKILEETATADASGITQAAPGGNTPKMEDEPKKTVTVINEGNIMNLEKVTEDRLLNRKKLNEKLFSSIQNKSLSKDINDIKLLNEATNQAAQSWILMEKQEDKAENKDYQWYVPQKWTNGGGGDGTEKGQPSAYEAWREAIITKHREARIRKDEFDRNNPYKSPTTTDKSRPTVYGQEDAFFINALKKQGVI